ncbi:MAG: aldo/keto reductase [Acidimicrobiia bacterium]|nr:aldo/keto reductase [Acidimicrobiia bacterium]
MHSGLVDPSDRPLGPDLSSGPLAYGCWRFTTSDVSAAQSLIDTALDNGLTLVDTADVYGFDWGGTGFGANEELLGKVLAQAPGLRDRMTLATKGGIVPPTPYDSSEAYLTEACEASLDRLGVDVIDLYMIHRPDLFTHPAEVAATLTSLRDAGKIREVGVSNFTVDQYDALAAHLPFPMVANQPELSAAHLDPVRDGTLDRCMRDGVTPLAWSPLGGGSLVSGEGVRPDLLTTLDRLADREGVDRATLALAFVMAHPSRPVAIIGTQNPDRIASAAAASSVHLDRNDVYDIVEASEGVPLP